MTRLTVVAALAMATVACGEKSTGPKTTTPPAVASVTIEPSTVLFEVGQQRVLVATTRDANGASLSGRTVQWQSSAPSIATVSASGSTATLAAIAPGVATITATSEGKSTNAFITAVPVSGLDFAITDAQWTQAAQQPNGAIPIVLDGNAAVLNVLMSTSDANRAPGLLKFTLIDAAGTVVRVDSVTPPAFTGAATYAAPTAQFLVPASQLRAGLRWSVQRDPSNTLGDANPANDRFPQLGTNLLSTVQLPVMRVRFVPITMSAHNNQTGNVSNANLEGYLPLMRRAFPLGRLVATVGTPVVSGASFGTPPTGGSETFWLALLQDLILARTADPTAQDEYFLGVVVPPTGFNFATYGGFASTPTTISTSLRTAAIVQTGWFSNTTLSSELVPHELAHTLGRRHAPGTCGAASPDPQFPQADGTIGSPGHDVYAWSIGANTFAATKAASMPDFMGYCRPQWVSPYTYLSILQARLISGPVALAAPAGKQQVVVVRGTIVNNRLELLPTVAIDGIASDGARGNYLVELLDDAGRVLTSQRAEATDVDHSDAKTLFAAIPLDERLAATVASVRISGAAGTVTRRRTSATRTSSGTRENAQLNTLASGRREIACTNSAAEAIVVQDHATGTLLASSGGARVSLDPSITGDLDVTCSDGVRSDRQLRLRR